MREAASEAFIRTEWLVGRQAVQKIKECKVAVFGVGGVGSYAIEALARCGIGSLTLIDHDVISESNINRQIHALHSTVGQYKAEGMKNRVLDINPAAKVDTHLMFFQSGAEGELDWAYDYIIDAVDTVTSKLAIILAAKTRGISVISAMGAGNKLEPERLEVADIYRTAVCPLAKVMRRLLREHGVESLKVVYSKEIPRQVPAEARAEGKAIGSIAFVPAAAGLLLAGETVKDIIKNVCTIH